MSNVTQKKQIYQCQTALDSLSEVELAAQLGICVRTLLNWRIKGVGPGYFKCGKQYRYPKDGVTEFTAPHPQLKYPKQT